MERHLSLLRVSPSTLSGYQAYVDRHIVPLIGRVKLGALDADVLDSFTPSSVGARTTATAKLGSTIEPELRTSVTSAASLTAASR